MSIPLLMSNLPGNLEYLMMHFCVFFPIYGQSSGIFEFKDHHDI